MHVHKDFHPLIDNIFGMPAMWIELGCSRVISSPHPLITVISSILTQHNIIIRQERTVLFLSYLNQTVHSHR